MGANQQYAGYLRRTRKLLGACGETKAPGAETHVSAMSKALEKFTSAKGSRDVAKRDLIDSDEKLRQAEKDLVTKVTGAVAFFATATVPVVPGGKVTNKTSLPQAELIVATYGSRQDGGLILDSLKAAIALVKEFRAKRDEARARIKEADQQIAFAIRGIRDALQLAESFVFVNTTADSPLRKLFTPSRKPRNGAPEATVPPAVIPAANAANAANDEDSSPTPAKVPA